MISARLIRVTMVSACLLALTACESPEPTPLDYGVRQVRQADRSVVLDAAEAALVERGYSIAKRDPAEGVITTESIENDPRDRGSRSGVGLSSAVKTRRFVEVRVAGPGDSTKVYCKVLVQEQAAQAYSMYAADRSGSDLPGQQTAIDRDAATTAEQNTVWRTLRRDTAAERQILGAILERTDGGAHPGGA
ncbi:MAG: hypothetical protein Q7R41_10035 [Phycisphaerales bacterium]|nr:hypothetical protein [Phycisphaerales bacterium]